MAKLYATGQKINSIFGVLTLTDNDKFPSAAIDDTYTKGFGVRETGVGKEIMKIEKHREALADPGAWLTRKEVALKVIGEAAGLEYKSAFRIAFEKGLTEKECEIFAKEAMNNKKKILMDQHHLDYPSDILGEVWHKIKK